MRKALKIAVLVLCIQLSTECFSADVQSFGMDRRQSVLVGNSAIKTPIGMYGLYAYSGGWTSALTLMRSNGFNASMCGVASQAILDTAQSLNTKCIIAFGVQAADVATPTAWNTYLQTLTGYLLAYRNHPATFAWYIADEPDWNAIPIANIQAIVNLVHLLDPKHPTMAVLTSYLGSGWAPYLPYFDIIGIDPYLQPGDYPVKVQNYITRVRADMVTQGVPNTPLWVVLGAFEQKRISDQAIFFRLPTPDEWNQMVQIALANNVNGVLVFSLTFLGGGTYYDWVLPNDATGVWTAVQGLKNSIN